MKRDCSLKKIIIALVSLAAMLTSSQAQTVLSGDHVVEGNLEVGTDTQKGALTIKGETGNTASSGIKVTGDGGVLFEGTEGVGAIPIEGAGVRMMWYPGKAAFRVGKFSVENDHTWTGQRMGYNSVAFGDSMARGNTSIAMSQGSAVGQYSTAMSNGSAAGSYSTAMSGGYTSTGAPYSTAMSGGYTYGQYSIAMNEGVAFGKYSIAMNGGWVEGDGATAMSEGVAGGSTSTAMSGGHTLGQYSTAMSDGSASGYRSTAMSRGLASGDHSTAMSEGGAKGNYTIAGGPVISYAFRSTTFGSYNDFDVNESPTEWVETDPIFVIGNGTGIYTDPPNIKNRNALVIRKNGSISVSGPVRIPPQGDLSMGDFTQEPTP